MCSSAGSLSHLLLGRFAADKQKPLELSSHLSRRRRRRRRRWPRSTLLAVTSGEKETAERIAGAPSNLELGTCNFPSQKLLPPAG